MIKKNKKNPVIKPRAFSIYRKIYNPGFFYEEGKYYLFCRSKNVLGISEIVLYISNDGVNFKKERVVLDADSKIDKKGVEDPRIVKIKDRYLMTYTAYDGKSARLCIAISKNLYDWKKFDNALLAWNACMAGSFTVPWDKAQQTEEAITEWSKAGGIFSKKIKDKYWMMFGDRYIWLAESDNGLRWQASTRPFIKPRLGFFDSVHVEMGPPPIYTEKGWVVLYHGINDQAEYSLGLILLDLEFPKKIIFRSKNPVMKIDQLYEYSKKTDISTDKATKPEVIFCNGAQVVSDKLLLYYGAGDFSVCQASVDLNEVLYNYKSLQIK